MKTLVQTALTVLASGLVLACGDGAACDSCNGAGGGGGAPEGGASSDGWTKIITGDWELAAYDEHTKEVHVVTLDRDLYVGAIRPIAPPGTHHMILALGEGSKFLYASGVGTNPLEFPPGVGFKLDAGQTLVLQLHVFNPTEEPLSGTSGIEFREVSPEDVVNVAEVFLPGPTTLKIEPNQTTTQSGTCTLDAAQTIFAVQPHMHQLGKHLTTTLNIAGVDSVLIDGDYEFGHQEVTRFEPISMNAGDTITTACTWDNTTSSEVSWGESSTAEMCLSILFRYPALGGTGLCEN